MIISSDFLFNPRRRWQGAY